MDTQMETQHRLKSIQYISLCQLKALEAVRRYRYFTAEMVQRLFRLSSLRTAQYRLHSLWKNGFVRRLRLPWEIGRGSNPWIYTITASGETYLLTEYSSKGIVNKAKKSEMIIRGSGQLLHLLAVNQNIIAIEISAEIDHVTIDGCIPYYNRLELNRYKLPFIQDAVFILKRHDRQALYFMEVDRDTEPIHSNNSARSSAAKMFNNYYNLAVTRSYKKFGAISGFLVLIITPTKQRRDTLINAAKNHPFAQYFWFSTKSDLLINNILNEKIWHIPGVSIPQAIVSDKGDNS